MISAVSLLIGIIIVLSVVQVVVSNRIVTTGVTLGKLQDELNRYKTENDQLLEKILIASSYTHIEDIVSSQGFVETKSPYVLSSPVPLAQKP